MRQLLRAGFERVEDIFDAAFGPEWNPFYYLGTLGWFFYWIVAASGIYLYIFFDTGVTQAYASVEALTHAQWYAGGVMRSLHRYASDALVVVVLLHLLREFALGRMRGRRWFPWITGVPLLWFIYACGVSGYWLVWDALAQYVAIATTEWLDVLPFFSEPIARNFLSSATLSGRFFTLMVYIHIAVPLVLLLLMWLHVQRHARARVNPPRGLAVGTLLMLTALSLALPAVSQAPADLDAVPSVVRLDWFYLAGYPLLDQIGGSALWLLVVAGSLALTLLPWLPPARRPPVAVVNLANCNGCARCFADCPFSAITMQPRSDGAAYEQEAAVEAELCMSCGICAGACPTATPFRQASALVPGIELPDHGIQALRERTLAAAARLQGEDRVIVYGCEHGAELTGLEDSGVACLRLPCVGMLPPPFVDFVISRGHAEGVMLAGCRSGDCHYRLGQLWTEERVAMQRDPYLRERVPRARLALSWAGPSQQRRRRRELEGLRARLRALGPPGRPSAQSKSSGRA